jgi:hypothetical protein
MTADSYLEMVLVLMGWLINNALWTIITTTGIFAIPLAFKIAGVWLKVREEGDDEGNKGALALPMNGACYLCRLCGDHVLCDADTGYGHQGDEV